MNNYLLLGLSALFFACQHERVGENTVPQPVQENTVTLAKDTVLGFKGMDQSSFRALPDHNQYWYHQVVVNVYQDKEGGDMINISHPDSQYVTTAVPQLDNGRFFGVHRHYLFVKAGQDTSRPELHLYDMKRKAFVYGLNYVSEPFIASNSKLWYKEPVEYDAIPEQYRPDCPDKAGWEQQGKKTGYGRQAIYDLVQGTVTQKSEYSCLPKD